METVHELDEKTLVGMLRPYVEAREQESIYAGTKKRFGDLLRYHLERHPGEVVWDGENRLEAFLQTRGGGDSYDIARAPEELVLYLWKLDLLEVNVKGVKAQASGEAADRLKLYKVPGGGGTSLQVQERRA